MALKVWLPLSSNTTNFGLSGVAATFEGTGSPTFGTGLFGGGSFTSGSGAVEFEIDDPTDYTVSLWYKGTVAGLTSTKTWNHVAVVHEDNSDTVYLNSEVVDNADLTTVGDLVQVSSANSKLTFDIGGDWNGSINDVKVYDGAISHREISELSKGMVLHYTFSHTGLDGQDLEDATNDYTYRDINSIEYDASGNNISGTVRNIQWSDDSPAYSGSYQFTGNGSDVTSKTFNTTEISSNYTIAVWVKGEGIVCDFSNGAGLVYQTPANEWVHVAITSAGDKFVNGVKTGSNSNIVGTGTGVLTVSKYWTGKMSDFRLYGTVLSDDQIAAMYNDKFAVDNKGGFHALEIVDLGDENEPVTMMKTGTVSANIVTTNSTFDGNNEVAGEAITKFAILKSDNKIEATGVFEV